MATMVDPETGQRYEKLGRKWVPLDTGRFREDGGPLVSSYGPYVGEAASDFFATGKAGFEDYFRGAQSLVGSADRQTLLSEQAAQQEELAWRRERSPIATAVGDYAPEIALAGLDRGRSLAMSMGLGGTEGLRLQDNASDQMKAGGISAGVAAAFPMVERVLRGATELASVISRRTEQSMRAKEAGLPVSAGDVTGPNTLFKTLDDAAEDIPGSNLFAADPAEQGQVILNQAANSAIGETGDLVTKKNLRQSAKRLNENYKGFSKALDDTGAMVLPDELFNAIKVTYPRLAKRQGLKSFQGLIEGADGTVTGSELMELHKLMVRQADLAENIDSGLARDIIEEVITPLDGMIESRLGPEATDLWRKTREQFRFHHLLTEGKSITGNNVNAPTLRTRTQRNMPEVVQRGEGERLYTDEGRNLVELTDLVADPVLRAGNQSGTPRRIGAMAGMAVAGDLATTGGTTIAAPLAAAGGINSLYQGASRRAPFLMGDIANQSGMPSSLLSNPGQLLDQLFYPFVGSTDDRRPQ